jgi:threonine dehydratase
MHRCLSRLNGRRRCAGAAAVAVAAFLQSRERLCGLHVVVLCCGGNISIKALRDVLAVHEPLL